MMAPFQAQEGSLFDLSSRVKLRVTGTNRVRFLNGQITNDVRKATDSVAIEACILSAKGKMNGHVFVSSAPDCFFIDADPDLRGALSARLERYVIADDVQIEDVSDRLSIFHVLAQSAPSLKDVERFVRARRFVEPGWDVWIESTLHDSALQHLSSTFSPVDAPSAEVFRIEQGIPLWGRELTEEIIPVEANLEARAIDYEKGCYIGQEVISRIKMSGQTNKRLCGLVSSSDAPLSVGMRIATPAEKDKEVGWTTSSAKSERLGKEIGLGFVKRGFNSVGTKLEAIAPGGSGEGLEIEIVSLPFG
jgi:folate-binding protein YgfZ